jgi:hypothetical protein
MTFYRTTRLLASLLVGLGFSFALIGMGMAQSTNPKASDLKTLFDPIEDFKLEAKGQVTQPKILLEDQKFLEGLIGNQLKTVVKQRNLSCDPFGSQGVRVDRIHGGAFTKVNSKQRLFAYRFCEPLEYFENNGPQFGLAIVEGKILVGNYLDGSQRSASYAVSDVNLNGLTELMVVVPASSKDMTSSAIQLLEFANGQASTLGRFTVGGPGHTPAPVWRVCQQEAPVTALPNRFQSNVIFVQKGAKPIFSQQAYKVEIKCLREIVYGQDLASAVVTTKVGGIKTLQPDRAVLSIQSIMAMRSIPGLETARQESRVLFENDIVMLFNGKLKQSSVSNDTAYDTLFVQNKSTGKIQMVDGTRFGSKPSFVGAVATQDGRLAYVEAGVGAGPDDYVLSRVDLSSGLVREVLKASSLNTQQLGELQLSPDERSLAFIIVPNGSELGGPSWGYQVRLGDFADPRILNPARSGCAVKVVSKQVQADQGLCLDKQSETYPCSK